MSVALARDGSCALELAGGVHVLFTARASGNLSLAAGVGHEHGLHARERLCRSLGLSWLCAGPQVHGTRVRRVRRRERSGGAPVAEPADGHATALRGVGMMVLTADCLPVLLCAPGAVAALHAGWRGLAAGVVEEGVRALRELSGADGAQPGPVRGVIGPCAGPCCYEVGAEVLRAFSGEGAGSAPGPTAPRDPQAATPALATEPRGVPAEVVPDGSEPAKAMLDMRAIARRRLLDAGVEVTDVEICTICDTRMFSHRREGRAAGRQAGIVWLS